MTGMCFRVENVLHGGVCYQGESLPLSLGTLCGDLKHTRDVIIEMY